MDPELSGLCGEDLASSGPLLFGGKAVGTESGTIITCKSPAQDRAGLATPCGWEVRS